MTTTELVQLFSPILTAIIGLFVLIERNRSKADFDKKLKDNEARAVERAANVKIEVDKTTADIQSDLAAAKERAKMLDFVLQRSKEDIEREETRNRIQVEYQATIQAFTKSVAQYTGEIKENTSETNRLGNAVDGLTDIVKEQFGALNKVSNVMEENGNQIVAEGLQIMSNSDKNASEIIKHIDQAKQDIEKYVDDKLEALRTEILRAMQTPAPVVTNTITIPPVLEPKVDKPEPSPVKPDDPAKDKPSEPTTNPTN